MIPRRFCIVCHGSGIMPDLEDSSRQVECEFCEPESEEITMDDKVVLDNGDVVDEMVIDSREAAEIKHSLIYANELHHGTVGHNILMLLAKLATRQGFAVRYREGSMALFLPKGVKIAETKRENP